MAEQQPRTAPATDRALVLQTITAAFGHTLGTLEAAAVAVQQGMAVLGAHAGAVILRTDESEYQLLARAGYDLRWGTQAHVLPSAPWPIVDAAENGTPVWIPSRDVYARRYPHLTTAFNAQTQAVAALPLLFDGRSIGALGLSFACAQRFSAGQRAMLETLAQLCAQALQRATLAEAVERQRREVEEAVRIRDDFMSLAAHEFRTPLTSLYGYAQLLRSSAGQSNTFSSRDRRAIEVIVAQVERFNLLVDTLLDVSRIDGGQLKLDRAPLDISEVVRPAAAEIQPLLSRHRLRVDESDAALLVEGDAGRLVQAFENLLLNAIKYSPTGGEIVVRVSRDGDQARVDVIDHGIGIPKSALPQLFSKFFRAGNVDALQIGGLGIGLYIVSEIVSLHGGTLAVESDEGQGSMFSVLLPLLNDER